jgi:hypothetical protein
MKRSFRIVVLGLALALAIPYANLNAQLFDKGDKVVTCGIGLGATYYSFGSGYKTTVPPLFVAGDYCLREDLGPGNLGVGGYIGYSAYKYDYGYSNWNVKYGTLIIGARGTYHFTELVDKLDLYGGILIGAEIVSSKYSDPQLKDVYNANSSGPAYSIFGGARYFFSDNMAATGELGYGIAWLSLGISFKF